ncbi:condensin complex subunit 1 [[Candida] jaroonii]|uniref:Condensin complex subunit 1 n=1 Tax=[Candida] jaroonii TaxID=467808 RepID=A0ACA9YCZ2_9ASCO|nr:condensin complex subunit 1 [[Candida] jaroonii]
METFSLTKYFNSFDVEKIPDEAISSSRVDTITNSLANDPETIHDPEVFEELLDVCHGFKGLESNSQKQLTYLVASSFKTICMTTKASIESGEFIDTIPQIKASLEKFGYLVFVLFTILGKEDFSGLASRTKNKTLMATWKNNCGKVQDLLDCSQECLELELSKIFVTTPERTAFMELFNRPIFHLMETPERMKSVPLKTVMFRCVCLMVKNHQHSSTVQNSIIQSLTYFIHLPPFMAELLYLLDSKFDYGVLTEEVLREVSSIRFDSNDNTGPKSISDFLVNLSQLSPRLLLKQMASIAQLLDNSNQTLRCSVVESCGNIVVDIIKSDGSYTDENSNHELNELNDERREGQNQQHIESLIDLLQERLLDQNPYVRTKAIQALNKICSLNVKFTKRKQIFMLLAVRSLDDRSTLVRRNGIKFMAKLVLNHPFATVHGTQLGLSKWMERSEEANKILEEYLPAEQFEQWMEERERVEDEDAMEVDEPQEEREQEEREPEEEEEDSPEQEQQQEQQQEEQEQQIPTDTNAMLKAKLSAQYYHDAVNFIKVIHKGTETISNLLFSKNRNEVLESMDFLVLADAYGIENSSDGIRRMLHLVWMKGSSDEGKSIASHLIDCYRELFLSAPSDATVTQKASYIAKNLINITLTSSLADLASFEKLICLMYSENLISRDVITILWQIYGHKTDSLTEEQVESSKSQRRGAIIVLGMMAIADNTVVLKGLDLLLNTGLNIDQFDDSELCKYTCIALQRTVPTVSKSKDTMFHKVEREDEIIDKLKVILLTDNDDPSWYGVAEQAISAIFKVSGSPDAICSDVIKQRSKSVFQNDDINSLSQLLFMVGHVAIKTIVFLEKLETFFKKKKHESEHKKDNEEDEENELEMIGGTTEDDFTDAVIYIKEKEILFGDNALLTRFGPVVREIISNSKTYDNIILQRSAVLCMVKLMCISSKFCEQNLPLLITVMEKSPDPIIRSNCVLGLGDMAVCFNNLVDENTDFLYRRLTDDNIMVQRTCLMTVTFLILAGQVKVKGQLSSMAKCLENEDQGMSDMCRLFFTELATKDNAIYNGFIDIFSGLSSDKSLDKESMKRIVKFLVGFIEKEKHQKQLSEKLLVRLNKSQTGDQWDDIAFVLQSIPYKNENITKALEEGFKLVT